MKLSERQYRRMMKQLDLVESALGLLLTIPLLIIFLFFILQVILQA